MFSAACCVQLFATPWTVAHQTPLFMRFPRQYWSGLSFSPPGDIPDPGIKPTSPTSTALIGGFYCATWEALYILEYTII